MGTTGRSDWFGGSLGVDLVPSLCWIEPLSDSAVPFTFLLFLDAVVEESGSMVVLVMQE